MDLLISPLPPHTGHVISPLKKGSWSDLPGTIQLRAYVTLHHWNEVKDLSYLLEDHHALFCTMLFTWGTLSKYFGLQQNAQCQLHLGHWLGRLSPVQAAVRSISPPDAQCLVHSRCLINTQ